MQMSSITVTNDATIADGSLSTVADVGDLPRQTSLLTSPPGGTPAAPLATGEPDGAGAPWSAALHESPPRRNAKNEWAKKRGNGARKARGLPNAGATTGQTPSPVSAPPFPEVKPAPASAFAKGSSIAPDPVAGADHVHDAQVDTPAMLGEADYLQTGEVITRGLFGVAQLTLDGKAWEPTPEEKRAFSLCIARIFAHYGFPRLGPIAELFFLVPPTVSKRADQPKTKRVLGWLAGLFHLGRTPAVVEQPPETAPADPVPQRPGRGVTTNPMASNPRFNQG